MPIPNKLKQELAELKAAINTPNLVSGVIIFSNRDMLNEILEELHNGPNPIRGIVALPAKEPPEYDFECDDYEPEYDQRQNALLEKQGYFWLSRFTTKGK